MHILEGAVANLADDPHKMDHGLHSVERAVQRSRIQHVAGMNLGPVAGNCLLHAR